MISLRQPEESGALSGVGGVEATQAALRDHLLVLLVWLERGRGAAEAGFSKNREETVTHTTAAAKERRDPSLLTMSANSVMPMR